MHHIIIAVIVGDHEGKLLDAAVEVRCLRGYNNLSLRAL